jgi:hypothetical protein
MALQATKISGLARSPGAGNEDLGRAGILYCRRYQVTA